MRNLSFTGGEARWSAGLLLAVVAGCWVLACLEPLTAVAVMAAGALPLGRALLLTGAAWLAGQAIGFGLRDFPVDRVTVGWGAGLGLAALLSCVAAALVLRRLPERPDWLRAGAAFIAAFVVDQAVRLGVEQVVEGSCEIVPGVIAIVGLSNAAWLAFLLAFDRLAARRLAGVGFQVRA